MSVGLRSASVATRRRRPWRCYSYRRLVLLLPRRTQDMALRPVSCPRNGSTLQKTRLHWLVGETQRNHVVCFCHPLSSRTRFFLEVLHFLGGGLIHRWASTLWALTIHSSRNRFAVRLNSGVRPLEAFCFTQRLVCGRYSPRLPFFLRFRSCNISCFKSCRPWLAIAHDWHVAKG
jgi:hypothetical protein